MNFTLSVTVMVFVLKQNKTGEKPLHGAVDVCPISRMRKSGFITRSGRASPGTAAATGSTVSASASIDAAFTVAEPDASIEMEGAACGGNAEFTVQNPMAHRAHGRSTADSVSGRSGVSKERHLPGEVRERKREAVLLPCGKARRD